MAPLNRRGLLLGSATLLSMKVSAMPLSTSGVDLVEASAASLARVMGAGRLSAEVLVQACLTRIGAVDRRGPRLNSVIERNPDALSIARTLDAERRAGRVRGPLHGLPVLLKDNIATGDRMSTSAGFAQALDQVGVAHGANTVKGQ